MPQAHLDFYGLDPGGRQDCPLLRFILNKGLELVQTNR